MLVQLNAIVVSSVMLLNCSSWYRNDSINTWKIWFSVTELATGVTQGRGV